MLAVILAIHFSYIGAYSYLQYHVLIITRIIKLSSQKPFTWKWLGPSHSLSYHVLTHGPWICTFSVSIHMDWVSRNIARPAPDKRAGELNKVTSECCSDLLKILPHLCVSSQFSDKTWVPESSFLSVRLSHRKPWQSGHFVEPWLTGVTGNVDSGSDPQAHVPLSTN